MPRRRPSHTQASDRANRELKGLYGNRQFFPSLTQTRQHNQVGQTWGPPPGVSLCVLQVYSSGQRLDLRKVINKVDYGAEVMKAIAASMGSGDD